MSKRRKRLIAIASIGFGSLFPVWAINVGWNYIDECALPPISDFPAVPDSTTATDVAKRGGSGGCWWERSIKAQSQEASYLLREMDAAGEQCGPRNVLTLRKTCTGTHFANGTGSIYLSYSY